jgi:hypothetical protein
MKPARLIFYGLAAFVILILVAMMLPVRTGSRPGKNVLCRMRLTDLRTALTTYHDKYLIYPDGGNSNIIGALAGDNPQKIVFLYFTRYASHPNEMVDPWETPYQIDFLQPTNFIISSAGKNKIFGDKDDIIFNSVSNDFVKP